MGVTEMIMARVGFKKGIGRDSKISKGNLCRRKEKRMKTKKRGGWM